MSTNDDHGEVRETKSDLGESPGTSQMLSDHFKDHLVEL